MNGTSVSNGTRLSPISISQRRFGNFPESFGKWKTPYAFGYGSDSATPSPAKTVGLRRRTTTEYWLYIAIC